MSVHWNQEERIPCCHRGVTALRCELLQGSILRDAVQNIDEKFCVQNISHSLPKLVNTEVFKQNIQKSSEKKKRRDFLAESPLNTFFYQSNCLSSFTVSNKHQTICNEIVDIILWDDVDGGSLHKKNKQLDEI